ncbi:hypothetical protein BDP55DRAFT_656599 [Colletotrichum godetiae]|uniref:Uncharacterized protein n=1 Tax=Colletotrichum godetiae TaxID=1209918 RepID=A0AAJ0ARZ2_9PEZI|nr:uncharacterized protein BDP55DRAFT_656599 [Colletotrichum godetiae]KAK1688643.1 hypothetical protein BDP55DRAFT_656599 [Colletotrichum godetiae]
MPLVGSRITLLSPLRAFAGLTGPNQGASVYVSASAVPPEKEWDESESETESFVDGLMPSLRASLCVCKSQEA